MGVKRSFQTLLSLNQKAGFDCPSCAWPDPDGKRKVAEFCENGAKAVASEATTKRLTQEIFAQHSISEMLRWPDLWLEDLGRITHPMIRRPGADHYEPISWEDAFGLIGRELRALASADEASFYTSGRASNEAAFLYGLFARQFGTNNLPDCSNMCHESSGTGLTEVIGFGKATVRLEDFDFADAIFVIGQNPGTNHPRMLTELQKAARNGCQIVSINPLIETGLMRFKNPQDPLNMLTPGTKLACLFLPVRINGDVALLKGIMKEMLEEDDRTGGKILAHDFIAQDTEGFEAFAQDIRHRESWERIVKNSGLFREQIREGGADRPSNLKRHDLFLGDGYYAAPERRREDVQSISMNFRASAPGSNRAAVAPAFVPCGGHSNVQEIARLASGRKMSPEFLKSRSARNSIFHRRKNTVTIRSELSRP